MNALRRRIERLEGNDGGKAPADLRAELARLRAEVERTYPGSPSGWSEDRIDGYFGEATGAGSARFRRIDELERLLMSDADRKAETAIKAELAAMTEAEIDAILAGMER